MASWRYSGYGPAFTSISKTAFAPYHWAKSGSPRWPIRGSVTFWMAMAATPARAHKQQLATHRLDKVACQPR